MTSFLIFKFTPSGARGWPVSHLRHLTATLLCGVWVGFANFRTCTCVPCHDREQCASCLIVYVFSPPPRFRWEWSVSIFVFLAFHSVAKDGLWFVRIIERGAGLVDEGGGEVVLSVKWLATINPHKPRFQWAGLLYMNDFRLSNIGHACFTVKK